MSRTGETCHKDPASCEHREACWLPAGRFWSYSCHVCGLGASAGSLEAAKTLFGIRAEKLKVATLLAKRGRGEELAQREEAMIAYSTFGNARRHGY